MSVPVETIDGAAVTGRVRVHVETPIFDYDGLAGAMVRVTVDRGA